MESGTSGIGFRLANMQSITGVLKLIELFCDVLAVILCGAASTVDGGSGHRGFFLFVSILALIITFTLIILVLLNVQNTIMTLRRWSFIELCWCAFIALFYFIASIVIATIAKYNGTYGAASFFGFAAFITYVADAVFQFRNMRASTLSHHEQQYAPNPAQQYAPNPTQQYAPNLAQQQQRQQQPTY